MRMRDLYILAPFLFVFIATCLGFFVYERDTKNPKNYFFLALMCVFILLNLFELKAVMAQSLAEAKSYIIAQALPLIFLPAVLFCFNNSYILRFRFDPRWYWAILSPFLVLFIIFVKLISAGYIKFSLVAFDGGFVIFPTFPFKVALASFFTLLVASFYPFHSLHRNPSSNKRLYEEVRHLFFAIFIPFLLILLVMSFFKRNILTGLTSNHVVYIYGLIPVASLLATTLLAMSIIKHKSFNISIIFNNAMVYSVLTLSISAIYVVIQNLLENFFQGVLHSQSQVYGIISALISSFIFEPLNTKINDLVGGLIDFFKSLNQPVAAEKQGESEPVQLPGADSLKVPYAIFVICFIVIFVCAKLLPGINPKAAYLISAFSLSLSSLYLIFRLLQLPFNAIAYTVISIFLALIHIASVKLTGGHPVLYLEAAGGLISTLCLITASALVGRIISVRIDEIAFLIPLCVVAAIADLWSAFYGVTSELLHTQSSLLDYLLIKYPRLGIEGMRQFIGTADFLFAAIFMGCAITFKFNMKKTYAAFAAGFVATFSLVVATGIALPAIPMLSICFIAANIGLLSLKYEDIKTMIIVISGSAVVFYIITSVRRLINK